VLSMADGPDLWQQFTRESTLQAAWKRVLMTRGAPGPDGMRIEDVQRDLRLHLGSLAESIGSGSFRPGLVRSVTLHQGDKERVIYILNVRDRIVHQALFLVLSPMVERLLPDCTFGFRTGRSAKMCVEQIAATARDMSWAFESDISSFFDTIPLEPLSRAILGVAGCSNGRLVQFVVDVLRTHERAINGSNLLDDMGLLQGSPLSPVLSNLYLLPMDRTMAEKGYHYYRYADDFLVLGASRREVQTASYHIAEQVQSLGLRLKVEKTRFRPMSEGIEFLGFHIDDTAAIVSRKAMDGLDEHIKALVNAGDHVVPEDLVDSLAQVLVGWAQYFGRPQYNPVHGFAAWLGFLKYAASTRDEDLLDQLLDMPPVYSAPAQGNAWYLVGAKVLVAAGRPFSALRILRGTVDEESAGKIMEQIVPTAIQDRSDHLLRLQAMTNGDASEDFWTEEIAWAESWRLFRLSAEMQSYRLCTRSLLDLPTGSGDLDRSVGEDVQPEWTPEEIDVLRHVFNGRDDLYASEHVDANGTRRFYPVFSPLTEAVWLSHLNGQSSIAQYVITRGGAVYYMVLDYDVQKPTWMLASTSDSLRAEWLDKVRECAVRMCHIARENRFPAYMEFSGRRGYHVWFFFEDGVPLDVVFDFSVKLRQLQGELPEGITCESFPNQKRYTDTVPGPLMKLPFGVHGSSGQRSLFVLDDGSVDRGFRGRLSSLARISRSSVAVWLRPSASEPIVSEHGLPEMAPEVQKILSGCSIVRHMVKKSETTHFLDHQERLFLLYVFRSLGDPGVHFLHFVIGHCFDYSPTITNRYIDKALPRPISCHRVRERFPELVTYLPCRCVFPSGKNLYPSPVRHSGVWPKDATEVAKASEATSEITTRAVDSSEVTALPSMPLQQASLGQGIGLRNKELLLQTIRRVNDFASQTRGVQRRLEDAQRTLDDLFESLCGGSDSISLDIGTLIRTREGDRYHYKVDVL